MTPPLHYPKGAGVQLSEHFNQIEFDCHCNQCSTTWINPDLIVKLEKIRELALLPVTVTSGYRCDFRQQQLRDKGYNTAEGRSQHQDGAAADIVISRMTGEQLKALAEQAGFISIGEARDWIHVDLRDDKPRSWKYF